MNSRNLVQEAPEDMYDSQSGPALTECKPFSNVSSMPPRSTKRPASSAVEDYLEQILELINTKGYARVVDIAKKLQISQASVTNMVQKLDAEGLLKYEKYRGLVLTTAGEELAKNITHRHQVLSDFLHLLGLDPQTIYHDVEGMEHHVSPATVHAIERLAIHLKRRPALLRNVQGDLPPVRSRRNIQTQ